MAKFGARAFVLLAAGALAALSTGRAARAGSIPPVNFNLGTPTVTATSAVFDVTLTFQGSTGDNIDGVQLSVVGSDPLLTKGGTDYSRFSFQLNTANVPGWLELVPISPSGFNLIVPDVSGQPLGPTGPTGLLFGTLTVDLTGIAPGTSLFATLAGGTPGSDSTFATGTFGGNAVTYLTSTGLLSITPPQVRFQTPGQLVPEPASLALAVPPVLLTLALAIRRRAGFRMHRVHKKGTGDATY
jgi:hypothetical protein